MQLEANEVNRKISWLDLDSPLGLLKPDNTVELTHDTRHFTFISFPRVDRETYFSYLFISLDLGQLHRGQICQAGSKPQEENKLHFNLLL